MNAAKKMTMAELIAAHAAELTPAIGDKAYTYYRGYKYVGVIATIDTELGTGIIEPENPEQDWGWYRGGKFTDSNNTERKMRGLYFGYEHASVYNVTEGMFHVIADAD